MFRFVCSSVPLTLLKDSIFFFNTALMLVIVFIAPFFCISVNPSFPEPILVVLCLRDEWIFLALVPEPLWPRDINYCFVPATFLACERSVSSCSDSALPNKLGSSAFQCFTCLLTFSDGRCFVILSACNVALLDAWPDIVFCILPLCHPLRELPRAMAPYNETFFFDVRMENSSLR